MAAEGVNSSAGRVCAFPIAQWVGLAAEDSHYEVSPEHCAR